MNFKGYGTAFDIDVVQQAVDSCMLIPIGEQVRCTFDYADTGRGCFRRAVFTILKGGRCEEHSFEITDQPLCLEHALTRLHSYGSRDPQRFAFVKAPTEEQLLAAAQALRENIHCRCCRGTFDTEQFREAVGAVLNTLSDKPTEPQVPS